jgi:hypothetical protein
VWSRRSRCHTLSVDAKADGARRPWCSRSSRRRRSTRDRRALDGADRLNAAIEPLWGEVKSLHWTSDKYKVQGC